MFKNRWGALFFVCLTVLGAANLIGSKNNEGSLLRAAADLAQAKGSFNSQSAPPGGPALRPAPDAGYGDGVSFTPDEELRDGFADEDDLVDRAEGFSPEPVSVPETEAQFIAESGDAVMLVNIDEFEQ